MSYIERDAAIENVSQIRLEVVGARAVGKTIFTEALRIYRDAVLKSLNEAPTADVVEVKHGEWRDRYDEKYANRLYECSLCGEVAPDGTVYDELERPLRQQILSPYCPNCGAKMDGERRDG